jgi:LEA14-like dessication related protein
MKGVICMLSTGLCFMTLSCASVNELVESAVQKPVVAFSRVTIDRLSFDSANLLVELKITNPNRLGVNLTGFDYDLALNQTSFLRGERDEGIEIPASGTNIIPIPLTLHYNDIYTTFSTLKSQDSTTYRISCGLSFNLPVIGEQRIPVSREGSIPLLKLPKISLETLKVKSLNLTGADLEMRLHLDNPNMLAFELAGINYDFNINEQNWLSGKSQERQAIAARGQSDIVIPFSLNFLQIGQSAVQLLNGDSNLAYTLKGNFALESSNPLLDAVTLPFERSGSVKIQR